MFVLNRKQFINPEMSQYFKDYTNKWIRNFTNLQKEKYSNNSQYIRVSDLVKSANEQPKLPNSFYIIPFVSLISFLAGYNFCKSIS